MIAKRIRLACMRMVLLGVLFAQAAVAANACLTANSMGTRPAADVTSSHCERANEISLNLCLYQWADQTDQSTTPPVVAAPVTAVLTVADAAQCLLPWIPPFVADNAGHDPPIPIRFCSFLI